MKLYIKLYLCYDQGRAGNQNGFPAFLLAETQTSGASYAARRRTALILVLPPRERVARLSHRAPERRLTTTPMAISFGRATMRRARRTVAAVLPYLIGFGILDVIGRFTALETQPLLEASNKIKWVVQLVCAGDILRFLAINAWPIIMEAPFGALSRWRAPS